MASLLTFKVNSVNANISQNEARQRRLDIELRDAERKQMERQLQKENLETLNVSNYAKKHSKINGLTEIEI